VLENLTGLLYQTWQADIKSGRLATGLLNCLVMKVQKAQKPKVLLKAKTHAFTVSIEMKQIYSFDKKGRLIGGYVDGINYKHGLDNSVLRKWTEAQNSDRVRQRRKLSDPERRHFFEEMIAALLDIFHNPAQYEIEAPEEEVAWHWLQSVIDYDFEALERDAEKFASIYKPVTILPPDQYYSLVLQITEGCSYNKCTFCSFYRDRPFRIKSPDALKAHIAGVNEFFGETLGLRQSIFLADANALIMPQPRLLKMLEMINESYPIIADDSKRKEIAQRRREGEPVFGGIYSFIDLFTGEYKSPEQFREMAQQGVKRAYIGMESGSKALLDFLNKPGSKDELIDAVNKIKAGGVNVGVIILIGAGGKTYSERHIQDTTEALNKMNLDKRDFIYFSDFHSQPGTPYDDVAKNADIEPLSRKEMRTQEETIKGELRYNSMENPPKITTYDIREFLY